MNPVEDPRFLAAVDMLRRCGSREFQIRYDEEQDPVVWVAVIRLQIDANSRPTGPGVMTVWKCAAGMNPLTAVLALCDETVDGGECQHCHRPAGFDRDFGRMPLPDLFCWYQFDPELATFRRGCEGT